MEQYRSHINPQNSDRMEIEKLLSEAKTLHERVASVLTSTTPELSPANSFRQFDSRIPFQSINREMTTSTTNDWNDLFRRGRELDERLRRLRFHLPPPLPSRENMKENDEETGMEKLTTEENEEAKENGTRENKGEKLLDEGPSTSVANRRIKEDELTKPTLRPALRFEPGLPAFKHDPVRRYELYKQEWAKYPVPGERKHSALRWKIREYMLRIDLPSDLNSRERFE